MLLRTKRRSLTRWQTFGLLATLILSIQPQSLAQEATGKIMGTVTDQAGAVVPDVKITVTNIATKIGREATTDKDGSFLVISLPIGSYQVTAEKTGFKRAVSDEQKLLINQALRIDIALQAGAVTETIEIAAGAAVIETSNPTLGQSITSRPLVNLPLNGRNVLSLALLMPGVQETTGPSSGGFSVAGGRGDSITYLLDGGVNNNLLSNLIVLNPNPDTVAEFRILTSNYTAEYGRNGGGIISVVTKSGTNSIHGSAFEFVRNNAFNANTFFNNKNGLPKEILKRNQYGFTVGGPIVLPKLDGRDRLFFFAGFQGQRIVQTVTGGPTPTFTPAELTGDFSHSGSASDVAAFLQANPFFQPNASLRAQGIIDPSKINSVAKNYISKGLIPTSPNGLLLTQGSAKNDRDELTLRFDANTRAQDRLAITLGSSRNPNITPFSSGGVPGFPFSGNGKSYFANIAYTSVFSPTLLNEFRFTTQRRNATQSVPIGKQPTASELGVGTTPDNPTGPPRLGFDSGLTIGSSPQGPTNLIDNTFVYSDTVSWIKGSHSLKFGASFSPYQDNTVFDFFVNGEFDFFLDGFGSGSDFANFLLGLPEEYFQFGEAPSDIRTKSTYGFFQDEWRIRKNLTLTLGLRYEYSQPKIDSRGRSFSLKLGQQSTVFKNAPKGVLFPGDAGAPLGANFPDKNDWAPRLGFAWDPIGDGKTSIRGGVGVFYDILKGEDNLQFNGQAPFFGFVDMIFDDLSGNPSKETNYFTNPFVATGITNSFPSHAPAPDVDFGASGFLPVGGGGVFYVDPHLRTPYTYQYNLAIQRELMKNIVIEAAYVGSSSHKLTSLVDANPFVLGTTHRLFNAQPGNNDASFSYLLEFRNVGTGNFNSLELSLQKRLSETRFFGTSYFTLAYTLAHSIDTSSGFRQRNSQVPAYNSAQFRANSDFDLRQRLVFSGGWDLPFDRAWSSGPKRLTQGWSLYPIATWRTGFPLDVFAALSASRTATGPSAAGDRPLVRANLVGSGVPTFDPKRNQTFKARTGNFYFDPSNFSNCTVSPTCLNGFPTTAQALANPALRTYGTFPRNALRGPGRTNFDLAIAKTTPIFRERVKLEIRAEAFNLFNHAEFNSPSTSITSSLFGQVTSTADPRIIQLAARFTF